MGNDKAFVGAAQSGKRSATTYGTLKKDADGDLHVPFREIDTLESISLGFRAQMFDMKDRHGNGGGMSTGSGFGTDAIQMEWVDGDEKRSCVVRGSEMLAAWVQTFDPEAAASIRQAIEAFG